MRAFNNVCEKTGKQAIAHLDGETSVLERQRFLAHLERCPGCRSVVETMSDMLEAARKDRFLPAPALREDLFSAVLSRIQRAPSDSTDDQTRAPRWALRRLTAFASASAVAIALAALVLIMVTEKHTSKPNASPAPAVVTAPKTESTAKENTSLETRVLASGLLLGVAPKTRYTSKPLGERHVLTVETGRIWISFKSSPDARYLEIRGAGAVVYVTGTVLMVDASLGKVMTVGVLSGSVTVVPDVGSEVELFDETLRTPDGLITTMDSKSMEQAETWLAHLAEGGAAQLQSQESEPPIPTEDQFEVEQPKPALTPRDLYAKAEDHMAAGRYKEAAKLLERLIRAAPNSTRADTARLDLASIYSGRLNRNDLATRHLRAYLSRHPEGAKSDLVRKRLLDLAR